MGNGQSRTGIILVVNSQAEWEAKLLDSCWICSPDFAGGFIDNFSILECRDGEKRRRQIAQELGSWHNRQHNRNIETDKI